MKRYSPIRSFSKVSSLSAVLALLSPFIFLALSFFIIFTTASNSSLVSDWRVATTDKAAGLIKAVSAPVQGSIFFVRDVSGLSQMQAENMKLKAENARLRDWYQTSLFLQSENAYLKQMLNLGAADNLNFITTRQITDFGNAYAKTVLLAVGRDKGIQKSQVVMSGEGVAGRVIEVGEKTSRVLLITDVNSRIPVIIQGDMHHAILAGDNSALLKLQHLPPGVSVPVGSRIITSGQGGIFPYGLSVGVVVEGGDTEVLVSPLVDLKKSPYLRVIAPHSVQ